MLAINESAKLIPYITSSRKTIKTYLKVSHDMDIAYGFGSRILQICLKLWSSAEDDVRIAAFLAIRTLMASGDESIRDQILKASFIR